MNKKNINNIVLIGLMGAGKTRIGQELSRILDLKFVDLDMEIEKAAGCSVSDIFELFGENEFRSGETRVLKRIFKENQDGMILATGGGAFINDINRDIIQSNGISIWLKAELELLLDRVSKSNKRPLLNNGNPREILDNLIKIRYPIYEGADITVITDRNPPKKMALEIIKEYREYRGYND